MEPYAVRLVFKTVSVRLLKERMRDSFWKESVNWFPVLMKERWIGRKVNGEDRAKTCQLMRVSSHKPGLGFAWKFSWEKFEMFRHY